MASYHSEDWLLQKLNKDPTADLSGIQSLASLFVDVLSPDSMEVLVSCLRSLRVSSITPQQLVHDWQVGNLLFDNHLRSNARRNIV